MALQVAAAIISLENKILIARRGRNRHLAGYWEFPGGKIEQNESDQDCLKRELLEELSITVQINSFFMENTYDYENVHILLKSYLCTIVSGRIKLIDHDEFLWVDKQQLKNFEFAPADIPIIDKLISA